MKNNKRLNELKSNMEREIMCDCYPDCQDEESLISDADDFVRFLEEREKSV